MIIRPATQSDISELHRVRMSVRENRLAHPSAVQWQHYETLLTGDGLGWVAEVDGRIVGFAVADLVRANVWALFVDPAFERRGIGRALHDTMVRSVFGAGVEHLWLTTDPGTRAEGFYRSAEWQYAGRAENGEVRYEMSRDAWLARQSG